MGLDAFIAAETVGAVATGRTTYKFNPKAPPAKAKKDAKKTYLLAKKTRLVDQTEIAIKQVLSNKQTIAFGFTVRESFEDQSWWATGKMPVPHASEAVLGGHEILAVGFLKAFPATSCAATRGTRFTAALPVASSPRARTATSCSHLPAWSVAA